MTAGGERLDFFDVNDEYGIKSSCFIVATTIFKKP